MVAPKKPGVGIHHLDADDLYWERVEWAREQSVGEKLLAGIELFNLSCEFMRAGIRMQNPAASEQQIEEMIDERLGLGRRLESGG